MYEIIVVVSAFFALIAIFKLIVPMCLKLMPPKEINKENLLQYPDTSAIVTKK